MDSVYSCVCATGNEETEVHPDLHAVAHLIQVNTGSATAFVTRKSAEHCAVAQQVLLSHDSGWGTMGHHGAPNEKTLCTKRKMLVLWFLNVFD